MLFKPAVDQATTNTHSCYTSSNTSCLVFVPYDHSHKCHKFTQHLLILGHLFGQEIDRSVFSDHKAPEGRFRNAHFDLCEKGYGIKEMLGYVTLWLCTVLSDFTLYSTVVTFIAYLLIYYRVHLQHILKNNE